MYNSRILYISIGPSKSNTTQFNIIHIQNIKSCLLDLILDVYVILQQISFIYIVQEKLSTWKHSDVEVL